MSSPSGEPPKSGSPRGSNLTAGAPQAPREGVLPLAIRLGNRFRSLTDRVFRYEMAWAVLGAVLLALLLARSPLGVRYGELTVGEPAPRDIIVPLDVEVPDRVRTAAMREAARKQVPPSYVFDARAAERAERAIAQAFQEARARSGPEESVREAFLEPLPPLSSEAGARLFEAARRAGFSAELERALRGAVRGLLSRRILLRRDALPADRPIAIRVLGEQRATLVNDFSGIEELDAARARALEAAARFETLAPAGREAVAGLLEAMTAATLTFDQPDTLRRMEEAAQRVPTLLARLERGTVLARRGSPLTPEIVEQVRALERERPRRVLPTVLAGTAILSVLLFTFLWRYPRTIQRRGRETPPHLFSMLVILVLGMLALTRGLVSVSFLLIDRLSPPFDRFETMFYLIPVAAGGMLAALLFSGRAAMITSVFFSLAYAMMVGWDLRLLAFSLITHFAAIYGATHYRTRTAPMKAGLLVGAVGAAAAVALDLASGAASGWQALAADAAAAMVGGAVGVSLLVSFLLPICESLFGVMTDVRLLELSNRNNPLLSQLAASAPGSYNHSLIVGTLAEAAAEAIGANGLFCRVAAFYHDVGKMKMPEYYIENQRPGQNPHDRLVPSMSALVIANHVKEGARLARAYGLPQQVLEVIPQHHGTRVMTYFYEKAKKAAGPDADKVNPDDFRYPGPKPQTREAAIFMLADSVEAAARTIDEPDPDKFRAMIRQIAARISLDGQFDECDLTFRDLNVIVDAFVTALMGIYHHRVDYPTYVFEPDRKERRDAEGRRENTGRREEAPAGTVPPGDAQG